MKKRKLKAGKKLSRPKVEQFHSGPLVTRAVATPEGLVTRVMTSHGTLVTRKALSGPLVCRSPFARQQRKFQKYMEACYEAGQIVIREHYGLGVSHISRTKRGTRKLLVPDPKLVAVPEGERATVARFIAISLLAGLPAQRMFEPKTLVANTTRDESAARRFLKLHGPGNILIDDYIVQLRKKAEDLVRKYKDQIASLAVAIKVSRITHHGLDRFEIMNALGPDFQQ